MGERPLMARAGRLPYGCLRLRSGPSSETGNRLLRRLVESRLWRLDRNLRCNQKCIVDLNPKLPNNALDLGVTK